MSVAGVYNPLETNKITVLNGSHRSLSDDPERDTVLVLPDYKVVQEVARSAKGAEELFKDAVDPAVPRAGAVVEGSDVRSYVLPYSCVILLCERHPYQPSLSLIFSNAQFLLGSHKKRDNRCHIAAPKLEHSTSHNTSHSTHLPELL